MTHLNLKIICRFYHFWLVLSLFISLRIHNSCSREWFYWVKFRNYKLDNYHWNDNNCTIFKLMPRIMPSLYFYLKFDLNKFTLVTWRNLIYHTLLVFSKVWSVKDVKFFVNVVFFVSGGYLKINSLKTFFMLRLLSLLF